MPTKLTALAAFLLGVGGAGVFFAFIVGTGSGYWPRGDAEGAFGGLNNLGWLLLFALQHSGMARQSFKRWLPATLERSAYVAASGSALAAMALCWSPLPGEPIWHGPIGIVAISLLAALGVGGCLAWMDHFAFFGLTQAWTGKAECGPLRIDGPYRYVRHPLALGLLIAIWAQPIMPPELLMMDVGLTIYGMLAIRLEERDLVRRFGADYEKYRRAVPR